MMDILTERHAVFDSGSTARFLSDPKVADFKTYNKCKSVERLAGAVNHPLTIEKETGKAVS